MYWTHWTVVRPLVDTSWTREDFFNNLILY